jgi:hypothetical protein
MTRMGLKLVSRLTYKTSFDTTEFTVNLQPGARFGMDRPSDHRFLANYFRLYLHAAALNLLVRLRREIAAPPPAPKGDVPVEVLPDAARKQYQNARRREDPLGKGQPATWRLLLIKVAASVVASCRRIVVRLSGTWPNRAFFEHISLHVSSRPAVVHCWAG